MHTITDLRPTIQIFSISIPGRPAIFNRKGISLEYNFAAMEELEQGQVDKGAQSDHVLPANCGSGQGPSRLLQIRFRSL